MEEGKGMAEYRWRIGPTSAEKQSGNEIGGEGSNPEERKWDAEDQEGEQAGRRMGHKRSTGGDVEDPKTQG